MRKNSYGKKDFRSKDNRKPKDNGARDSDGSGWKKDKTGSHDKSEKSEGFRKPYKSTRKPADNRSDNSDRSDWRKNKTSTRNRSEKSERFRKPYKSTLEPKDNRADNPGDSGSDWKKNETSSRDRSEKSEAFGKPFIYKRKFKKSSANDTKKTAVSFSQNDGSGLTRLNKYIANAGICSRREADVLITSGVVSVNGVVITEMGFKVKSSDVVSYGGQTLRREKMVYVLLNKPKDYITTVDDPQKRRTVLELVRGACRERIYPVGRLDRGTTGVLLMTNDGELTKCLTHPRYGVKKIYHVVLDKNLKHEDFTKVAEGIELEDGLIKVDEISYVGDGSDKKEIGIEIHSGRNRIVRRIFEHLGYSITKLDRVYFAGLNKKDLSRGRWRFLTEAEVGMLKMAAN